MVHCFVAAPANQHLAVRHQQVACEAGHAAFTRLLGWHQIQKTTVMTWKLPGLVALLNSYLLLSPRESSASEWASIQLLRNVQCKPHVD